MRKKILLLMGVFSLGLLQAQIGVNTDNPQTLFHVDGGGDNNLAGIPTDVQIANDVVITSDGNVGIGTINPDAKIHIVSNGAGFRYDPAGLGAVIPGHILVSNNNGDARWAEDLRGNPTILTDGLLTGTRTYPFDGAGALNEWHPVPDSDYDIPASAVVPSRLTLTAGTWMVFAKVGNAHVRRFTAFVNGGGNAQDGFRRLRYTHWLRIVDVNHPTTDLAGALGAISGSSSEYNGQILATTLLSSLVVLRQTTTIELQAVDGSIFGEITNNNFATSHLFYAFRLM